LYQYQRALAFVPVRKKSHYITYNDAD